MADVSLTGEKCTGGGGVGGGGVGVGVGGLGGGGGGGLGGGGGVIGLVSEPLCKKKLFLAMQWEIFNIPSSL